jgi:hypothetical protein
VRIVETHPYRDILCYMWGSSNLTHDRLYLSVYVRFEDPQTYILYDVWGSSNLTNAEISTHICEDPRNSHRETDVL